MPPHTPATRPPVLVVEDSDAIRRNLVLTLESAGYTTRQAGNGREALAALAREPRPAAILLDVVMPEMNGWEFLREREARFPELADIPVILFTGAWDVAPRMPPPRGVMRVLAKPVGGLDVLAALSDLLEAVEQQVKPPVAGAPSGLTPRPSGT